MNDTKFKIAVIGGLHDINSTRRLLNDSTCTITIVDDQSNTTPAALDDLQCYHNFVLTVPPEPPIVPKDDKRNWVRLCKPSKYKQRYNNNSMKGKRR